MAENGEEGLQVVAYRAGGTEFGADIRDVREIIKLDALTAIPGASTHVEGVINVRGKMLSVLDIRRFWGLPGKPPEGICPCIVVRAAPLEFALLTDNVLELAAFPLHAITPPVAAGVGLEHIQGVSPEGVVIIDVESLVRDRRLIVHEEL